MSSRPFDFPMYERMLAIANHPMIRHTLHDDAVNMHDVLCAAELFDCRSIDGAGMEIDTSICIPPLPYCWLEWGHSAMLLQHYRPDTHTSQDCKDTIAEYRRIIEGRGITVGVIDSYVEATHYVNHGPHFWITGNLIWTLDQGLNVTGGMEGFMYRKGEEAGLFYADIDPAVIHQVSMFLTLCHCQNVSIVRAQHPRPLRRRLDRLGVPDPHMNVLKLTGTREVYLTGPSAPEPGDGVALHRVRGHFKRYTPERPLFGRIVGTVWHSDHLRGNPERGTIQHQYEAIPSTLSVAKELT